MNEMKRVLYRAMAVLLSVSAVAVSAAAEKPAAAQNRPMMVNRVAATVNGRPITAGEVRQRLAPYVHELMMLYPEQGPRFNAELVKAKKQVLRELIERELVLSEFENKGYMIKEEIVDREISRRILMQFNGNRDTFLQNLARAGMTMGEYRESVRRELQAGSMRNTRYERDLPPTPDELRAEYNATKSEYRDVFEDAISYYKIFLPFEAGNMAATPEAQYARAKQLVADIKAGRISFADAAKEFSRDAHAENGGEWPLIKRKDLAVEFANIVFSAKPGELVGPLGSPQGLTIVKVKERRLAPAPPLEKVKAEVDAAVRRKQSEQQYRRWVERLRNKAVIRTFI
ncbi:MAG: SurA N-terminal domain-containing protein [Akkermansia muciniphila]|nr:SurA N-terminal domain-containing protein [Akkermansia muciniphila]